MATVQDIFGEDWQKGYSSCYRNIVDHFAEVLYAESFGQYQGDMIFLVRDKENVHRVGFLVQGYGSCSGCDALEAAEGYEHAMNDLISSMENRIEWHDSPAALIDRFQNLEYGNPYYISEEEWPACHKAMVDILKNL